MSLRELKKEQTRQLIADTAWRLFSARGFDPVTVTEIAREARVAPATVFNYFPTKEDLFYSGLDVFGAKLVEAVGARPSGEPVLTAVRSYLLRPGGFLELIEQGDADALQRARTLNHLISTSTALQAREQQIFARQTAALATLLAEEYEKPGTPQEAGRTGETDHLPTAQVVANALMGVHRALIDLVRRRVLTDDRPEALAADVQRHGERAFALLEEGLRDHARKTEP